MVKKINIWEKVERGEKLGHDDITDFMMVWYSNCGRRHVDVCTTCDHAHNQVRGEHFVTCPTCGRLNCGDGELSHLIYKAVWNGN